MKLLFLMRYDYMQKSGGDVVQIKAYIKQLTALGHDCTIGNELSPEIVESQDAFFIVNIDRPIETVEYFSRIKKISADKNIYIIPIHHPIDAVTKFEQSIAGGFKRMVSSIFRDYYSREKIKNLWRFKKSLRLTSAIRHIFINYRKCIRRILLDSNGIIYISQAERRSVQSDFSFKSERYIICSNAVEISAEIGAYVQKTTDVILVGRIEERKNIVNVLKCLAPLGYSITIVGALDNQEKNYISKFQQIVEKYKNVCYLGVATHDLTLKYIAAAKVLINASYFEVNPLVDLEAALLGTDVISTKYSYTEENIPNVIKIDPYDLEGLPLFLEKVFKNPQITLRDISVNTSWKAAAISIDKMLLC